MEKTSLFSKFPFFGVLNFFAKTKKQQNFPFLEFRIFLQKRKNKKKRG